MTFLKKPVDNYGHTIISDEFSKSSGYDAELTAETIRATDVWMAVVQSLYDAVALCDEGKDPTAVSGGYSNPVDVAAAFWFGDLADGTSGTAMESSGTMYAWAKRARDNFALALVGESSSGFDANAKILEGLNDLQSMLPLCWPSDGSAAAGDEEPNDKEGDVVLEVRMMVDDVVRYMTVPLVQNLIHYSARVAEIMEEKGESDVTADEIDYVILYGLVTIPPITICDETAYDSLYKDLITNAKADRITTATLYNMLISLHSRLLCLGIECDWIGESNLLSAGIGNSTFPTCQPPSMDFKGYAGSDSSDLLERMKVDLDIRTIGTLIEMEAPTAAYDVYHWGKFSRDKNGLYYALQDTSLIEMHTKNTVGKAFDTYFENENYEDLHEYQALMGLGDFTEATPTQRRIITEASMVLITLHSFALNSMYKAVDDCRAGVAETTWDTAFASLSGWAEESEYADEGFLFMEIARFLCEEADKCNSTTGDSEINRLLLLAIQGGKGDLQISPSATRDCDGAEEKVKEVEKLLQTILVDVTAYFAEQISEDVADMDNLAEGYGIATALVPLMQLVDSTAANVIKRNMGVFGPTMTTEPFADGKEVVFDALKSFVASAMIDCDLLTRAICDGNFAEGPTGVTSPTVPVVGSPTSSPNVPSIGGPTFPTSPTDMEEGTMTSNDMLSCGHGIDGGLPIKEDLGLQDQSYTTLLRGAYNPTSNVDHIVKLTDNIELVSNSGSYSDGVSYYTQVEDGVSLACLSTGTKWVHITTSNPLYVIYMYGLWISDDGDNSADGYSNKMFDDGAILNYGDTVVNDEFDKKSGFDAELTAETIRVMNVWMAMTTEMYRAATSCRDGYVSKSPQGFNPVDFAAALWFGSAEDPDSSEGASLYAWAKRAEMAFTDQGVRVTEKITSELIELQAKFVDCRDSPKSLQEKKGIDMKHRVDDITRLMVVPLVQNFIHHLATESGLTSDDPTDERNYMVLYALTVLPFISICDEDLFDDLFTDLIADIDSYDSETFADHLETVYGRFECLGITCDMVGTSKHSDEGWPECKVRSVANTMIAGYTPTSDASLEMLKIDLDISTILTFIIMEANDAALDIYENGRNAKNEETSSIISLQDISIPSSHPDVIVIYNYFASDYDVDYTAVTENSIMGKESFLWSSVMKNSAAASLAIATIDMHMSILGNMYQAVTMCEDFSEDPSTTTSFDGWDIYWDSAVAAAVGWTEGTEDGGSVIDGYLFFQLAQELCEDFDSCEIDGQSSINKMLIAEFKKGQVALGNNECEDAQTSKSAIESYLQAILVDNLAYHSKFADSQQDERHCLMAHVAANALVPLIRSFSEAAADVIETNVGASANECHVNDADAVYQALNEYVIFKKIDCSLLGSSVCSGTSTTVDSVGYENNDGYIAKTDDHTLFNGEYIPLADVKDVFDVKSVVSAICGTDRVAAKDTYLTDDRAGITIEAMSVSAKYVMADELQFNQYVYALQDSVDKTDGSLLFDSKPAMEYANTITGDALETSATLGCLSVKVVNIWMWIVHLLNTMIDECKEPVQSNNFGVLDEAAALWEGSLLYDMTEELGPKFGHSLDGGMTFLNRQIVNRLKQARDIISNNKNICNNAEVHDLRIIVKETVSFMTAVLIQSFIDSMLDDTVIKEKQEAVELMSFATLPHIKTCGHESVYESIYDNLIRGGFDEDMIPNAVTILQSHYNCLGLSCDDVGRHTKDSSMHPQCSENLDIAGYAPVNATKTNMIARLDLDAVAIHQMMSMEKYELAKRIYEEGHNYYDYDNQEEYNFVSLYNLTQSHTIDYTDFPIYQLYKEYYPSSDIGNYLINQAFDRTGPFLETTAPQRELAVNIAISSFVSYMAALEALYFSVSKCGSDVTAAETAFDGAVALLVGSVEGRGRGGSSYQEGRMFYSIAKRNCVHFHYCRGADAQVNVELFLALTEGQDFIKEGNCADAAKAVESINAHLKVSLIQSLLYFSDSTISGQSDDDAAGYVATMAVLPILNDIDPGSANTIKLAMDFPPTSATLGESKEDTVHSALTDVFSNPKTDSIVDCSLVTNIEEICNSGTIGDVEPVKPIKPDAPMPISNGLYVATNYVGDRSAISLDVQEIESFLNENNADGADLIYSDGLNSKIYDEDGEWAKELRSIKLFSTEAGNTMRSDPTYNLFIYGLSDENQEFMGRPTTLYADSIISNLLYSNSPEASNAMVAVTIWMQVTHSLHSAYGSCKSSFLTDGRTTNGRHLQDNDPSLFIDEAAAYWIGDKQDTGSSSKGHLLYALTEFIGEKFEKIPSGSESTINTHIIDLFNKAKNHIAISRGCSTSEDSHLKLKNVIDELISLMAVPLIRCLLYYLSVDNPPMVKVYAVAILPLFSACSPAAYYELKDELIDNNLIEIRKDYIYSKIQSMYGCLGLTCGLVGFMHGDDFSRCDVNSHLKSLAGYRYETEQDIVTQASHIDVEAKKVEIFIENGMYHFPDTQEKLFGTAYDLYRYGQHPNHVNGGSLSGIARNTNRDIVPAFADFRNYFSSDAYYADTMITNAFQKKGVFEGATVDQRKRFIAFTLRYMVTYMAILEKLYGSIVSCTRVDNRVEGAKNFDIAASYFIGSLEGKDDGGSFDGNLIHMLAKRMCLHFGTCTTSNNARINERIISLFYAGQGEVETGACESLRRTVEEIEDALIVPLIQGLLFSARQNELHFNEPNVQEFYPEGYALAQSILPLINKKDQSSALNIKNVMVASFPGQGNDAGSNDAAKVYRAVKSAVSKMDGVDCSQIGSLGGYGFCPGDEDVHDDLNPASSLSVSLATLVMTGVLLLALY